jgi:hypothetical protein
MLLIGIILMTFSWYLSYPLTITSVDDYVFNHVSVLYWVSLPLLLVSMFLIATTTKNTYVKWIMLIGFVATLYSLSYFYYRISSSDSHFFRGLMEYFAETKDLDPMKTEHFYYQWPSFFFLADMTTSVTGITLAQYEFVLFAFIGVLLTTTLYVYASRSLKKDSFMAVASFFIAMFYFLNYQSVPFSLAFGLLCLLFMLETRKKDFSTITTMILLIVAISLTHAFVALFFVIYSIIRCVINRSKSYGLQALITLMIYVLIQVTQAPFSFAQNLTLAFTRSFEYSAIVETTLVQASVGLDVFAQTLSRLVTVMTILLCFVGFVVLLIKKRTTALDKGLFLTGAFYSAVGVVLVTLGSRAIPVLFLPVSLGASFLLDSKFRKYISAVFLVLLVLFISIPIHTSFIDSEIMFQTEEALHAENFVIDKYDWTTASFMLAHYRVLTYLQTRQPTSIVSFEDDVYSPDFPRLSEYDTIVYTVGLGKNLLKYNYTFETTIHEERFNLVYSNGFSSVGIKSSIAK